MKRFLSLILLFAFITVIKADDASWTLHPIFDEEVKHVVETPTYVYFTSQTLKESGNTEAFSSLFRYDKMGEELMALSATNILNDNSIRDVVYNPEKGYLAILYKNYNIDLLYNDGKVVNIPYYKQSSLAYSKNVKHMTTDPSHDRLYLATDFGYVALNDKKYEIAESRIYGEPIASFCRLGDTYLAIKGDELLSAPADESRLSLDQYEVLMTLESPFALYPVGQNILVVLSGEQSNPLVNLISKKEGKWEKEELVQALIFNADYTSNGLVLSTSDSLYLVKPDGTSTKLTRHENYRNSAAVSTDMAEVWNGLKRKGLCSLKKTGDQWSLTRDWMLPNAPAPFASTSYLNHPDKGILTLGYGYRHQTSSLTTFEPFQLSGLKQGRWTNYAPVYTNSSRSNIMRGGTNGLILDPDNKNYIYISSYHDGFLRLNLNNPHDLIHLAKPNHSDRNNEGFAALPDFPTIHADYCNLSEPMFDKQGNLWMAFPNWDEERGQPNFYCWLAADRRASTPTDIKPMKHITFDGSVTPTNNILAVPLHYTGNGLIAYTSSYPIYEELLLIDTNGTPTDTSDDKVYKFPNFVDSDGNTISISRIRYLWEDPSTGYVWLCHSDGVCYFIPSQVRNGIYQVNRIKVPRNDGTNLADYLLDGVDVNYITADSEGRKWFSTSGAGIACTSSDGREIIEVFNTENSPLPSDIVFSAGYDSSTNSLIISTLEGFAQYSLPVSQSSSTKEDIRAYPNPVRPNYNGYVTITDIPTGSFVKIVDSAGNLVKELGIVSGFDILWDLSDSRFNRVRSGIYYIMVSPSDERSSYSTVGKILVMS